MKPLLGMAEATKVIEAITASSPKDNAWRGAQRCKGAFKSRTRTKQAAKIASLTGVDDSVFVDFAVPQEMAGRLPIGTPIQLFRMDEPDKPFSSTIVSDDMMLSDRTRTIRTRVRATNTAAMRPGMSVNVQLPASLPQRVVTVHATSIRRAAWGDFVYVVTTDAEGKQRAQQRGITVGPSLGERVVVRKGITAGTDVVADGSFKLAENALIVSTPPSTQPVAK